MIESLKPYPRMKDTGLAWAGNAPEHWRLVPNRVMLRKRKALVGDRHIEHALLSLTKSGVIVRDISTGRGKFSADIGTSQEVRAGNLVFCLFDVPETPRTVGLSQHDGMITGAYTVFECLDYQLAKFLEVFYIAMDDRKLLSPLYTGLRNTIQPSTFLGIKTPVPPPAEQAAIVRFLEYADRRIRRYIRAKQKLIKLLEEQRQAIIHRAVTRGVDPDVNLRSSGVEWLGDVPEHWEVQRVGRIAKVFNGTTPSRIEPVYWTDGTIPWLSSGKVNDYIIETASEFVTEQALRECSISIVPKGAIVIGLVGQGKTRGKSAILGIDACINQNLAAIVPWQVVSGSYLHNFLTAFYGVLREYGRGGNQEALNCQIVANWRIAVPPLDEQVAICNSVQSDLDIIRPAVKRVQQEISLLLEYRTRLIADVVTGKLDVRDAAARLPDEIDDTEPLDDVEDPAADDDETDDEADVTEDSAA